MLIVGLLLFQSRVPKEGDQENQVIEWICTFPQLNTFTYFELNYILKNLIYPSIFSCALWMSRMIDENPNIVIRSRL